VSTVLDYAAAYLECRFPTSPQERLVSRVVGSEPAPLFVLARTPLGCIWRFREDLAGSTIRALSKLAGREGPLATPIEDAPPPERQEPMSRVLFEVGLPVEVARDLLMHRAGWAPTRDAEETVLFQLETPEAASGSLESFASAQMGSSDWNLRGALERLDAREWVRFADLICFRAAAFDDDPRDQIRVGSGN
jgi:hypothetical protein